MTDIPLSKAYLHDLRELHLAREEKRITDEEYSKLSDELRERAVQSNSDLARWLLLQKFAEVEQETENEIKKESQQTKQELEMKNRLEQAAQAKKDLKQRQEREREEKKMLGEQQRKEKERNRFRSEINTYITILETNAQRWQIRYTWLQIILLVFSAGTAAMASIDGVPRWVVSVAGLVATVAGGLLTTFKIQDRIYASRKAVVEVKLECQKYDYHIDEYKNANTEEEAFITFTRKLSAIQGQEMLQEVELWNPKKDDKPAHDNDAQRSLATTSESKEEPDEQQATEVLQIEDQKQVKEGPNE